MPATTSPAPLSAAQLLRFWLPLLATWLMMAVEGPFLTAVIARLGEPTISLAAYGIAYALAIIVESPVIMLMSASTQLVRDADSLRAMERFTWRLNLLVSAGMVLLLLPWLWDRLAAVVLHLPPAVADATHAALWWLLPWPAAIGDRRFHQGILIRAGQTGRVGLGTVFRLVAMLLVASVLARLQLRSGAEIGAIALSAGVLAEAIAVRAMARGALRDLRARASEPGRAGLRLGRIWSFYAPLALTMVLSMAIQPLVTLFLGRSRMALESLAVLPVLNALTFLFRSWGLSFQEVAIAKLGQAHAHFAMLQRFATGISLAAFAGMALIVWTPLAGWWFSSVSGLPPALYDFVRGPARLAVLLPALSALLSMQRALLVHAERTAPLGRATVFELVTIAACLGAGIFGLDLVGAYAAILAMLLGRLMSCAVLWRPAARSARRLTATIALSLCALASQATARDWFVAADAPAAGDGSASAPFGAYAQAYEQAQAGDRILLAVGIYRSSTPILVNGQERRAAMPLREGVVVLGAGATATILRADEETFYGITGEGLSAASEVAAIGVEGAFVQALNLRDASPRLRELRLCNDVVGGSSVAADVRDGSFPELVDCVIDGGHSALFVEFGSGGLYRRCRLGVRPNESLAVIASTPLLEDCEIGAGGRDTIVLAQGAQPRLLRCRIADGARWTVRVCCYAPDSVIDLSGNVWSSADPTALQARILDARDESALGGRVRVTPFHDVVSVAPLSFGELRALFSAGSSRPD